MSAPILVALEQNANAGPRFLPVDSIDCDTLPPTQVTVPRVPRGRRLDPEFVAWLLEDPRITQGMIARRFGVSRQAVSLALQRRPRTRVLNPAYVRATLGLHSAVELAALAGVSREAARSALERARREVELRDLRARLARAEASLAALERRADAALVAERDQARADLAVILDVLSAPTIEHALQTLRSIVHGLRTAGALAENRETSWASCR